MQRKTLILLTFLFSRVPGAQVAQALFYFILGGLLLTRVQYGIQWIRLFFTVELLALILLALSCAIRNTHAEKRRWCLICAGVLALTGAIVAFYADAGRFAAFGVGAIAAAAGAGRFCAGGAPRISALERILCGIEGIIAFSLAGVLLVRGGGNVWESAPYYGSFFLILAFLVGAGIHWKKSSAKSRA